MNAQTITNIHEDIVKVLVNRLQDRPNQAILSYDELCKNIESQVGCRNIAAYLGDISYWCNEIGAPLLSVMVINKTRNRPGKGFFKLYADINDMSVRSIDEELIFITELRKVMEYRNWEKLKYYLGI